MTILLEVERKIQDRQDVNLGSCLEEGEKRGREKPFPSLELTPTTEVSKQFYMGFIQLSEKKNNKKAQNVRAGHTWIKFSLSFF